MKSEASNGFTKGSPWLGGEGDFLNLQIEFFTFCNKSGLLVEIFEMLIFWFASLKLEES